MTNIQTEAERSWPVRSQNTRSYASHNATGFHYISPACFPILSNPTTQVSKAAVFSFKNQSLRPPLKPIWNDPLFHKAQTIPSLFENIIFVMHDPCLTKSNNSNNVFLPIRLLISDIGSQIRLLGLNRQKVVFFCITPSLNPQYNYCGFFDLYSCTYSTVHTCFPGVKVSIFQITIQYAPIFCSPRA